MNKHEIIEQTIRDQLNIGYSVELRQDANLFDDLNADSLDHVELAMALEMLLDQEVPDAVAENWRTVGDVMATFGVREE